MSTALIVVIVIAVIVVIALVARASARRRQTRQLGEAQVAAKRDDVSHHREQARDARGGRDGPGPSG